MSRGFILLQFHLKSIIYAAMWRLSVRSARLRHRQNHLEYPALARISIARVHISIAWLPNLFTTAALFAGFYSITESLAGDYATAAAAILCAAILDGLDGRIARMTHTESEFGSQYDSLSDMTAFGIAPAVLIYLWTLQSWGGVGIACAFVYVAGAAMRLARFNATLKTADKRVFLGLPSPAAAAIIGELFWFYESFTIVGHASSVAASGAVLTGLLMVSNFRYPSFKRLSLRRGSTLVVVTVTSVVLFAAFAGPVVAVGAVCIAYGLSGPFRALRRQIRAAI